MDLFAQPKIIEADSKEVIDRAKNVFELLNLLEFHARVHAINQIRLSLHKYSPFVNEPVELVLNVPVEPFVILVGTEVKVTLADGAIYAPST